MNRHLQSLLLLSIAFSFSSFALVSATERVYYVGIIERDWDYSPNKINEITGKNITADR